MVKRQKPGASDGPKTPGFWTGNTTRIVKWRRLSVAEVGLMGDPHSTLPCSRTRGVTSPGRTTRKELLDYSALASTRPRSSTWVITRTLLVDLLIVWTSIHTATL